MTVYPFNENQVRKIARVKLEYTHLFEENKTLHEMMTWCDSVMGTQVIVIERMDGLLIIKDEKIVNLKSQNKQVLGMYELAGVMIKKERKLKWIFMGTTIVVVGFLTLSLL